MSNREIEVWFLAPNGLILLNIFVDYFINNFFLNLSFVSMS